MPDALLGPLAALLILVGQTPDALLGPYAGLALSLSLNGLLYTGKLMPRNTVRREDFDALQKINADNAEALNKVTDTMDRLVTAVGLIHKNGGL